MAGLHAYLPPSAADIWGECSAFGLMNAANPHGLQMDTDQTEEGTLAHAGLAALLTGQPAPFGMPREMQEAVEWAAGEITGMAAGATLAVEQTLPPDDLFGPDVWGTPDALWWAADYTLNIADFKYGHRYVPVIGNRQLIAYAVLAIDKKARELGVGYGAFDPAVNCRLTIIQPRNYGAAPLRSWVVPGTDLRAYANGLADMAGQARSKPTATPGLHCRHCPGILACEAHKRAVSVAVDVALSPATIARPTPEELGARLSIVSRAAQMIDAEQKALETHGAILIDQGGTLPGWHLEPAPSRTKWAMPDDQVLAIGAALGADLAKKVPITPAQAAKKGVSKVIIDQLTQRGTGELKLTQDDVTKLNYIFSK